MGFFNNLRENNRNSEVTSKKGAAHENESDSEEKESSGALYSMAPPTFQLKSQVVQKLGEEEEEMLQGKFDGSLEAETSTQPFQLKSSSSGNALPENLQSGIESLSGYSMDDVNVHYNSEQPAQLNAHAYAQGTDIHIASGQEKHLPHEAWHVAQQKQGRVNATTQTKGVNVNDDTSLEHEADVMGEKAISIGSSFSGNNAAVQRKPTSPFSLVSQLVSRVVQMVKPRNKAAAETKIGSTGDYYKNGIVGGGKTFQNREGRLPKGSRRNRITYTEYDVNPYQNGQRRDAERLVKGSDGRIWYTSNHYRSFTEVK